MLKWYNNLYVGDTAKKKSEKIIKKINRGTAQFGVYVITLASNQTNHLDIFSANYLLQKKIRAECPLIVGLAKGYEEAVFLVRDITDEVFTKTNTVNIRSFLEDNQKN